MRDVTAPTWPRSAARRCPVAERIDLSCSGAVTRNIFRAGSGGQGQNGEAPQADKLPAGGALEGRQADHVVDRRERPGLRRHHRVRACRPTWPQTGPLRAESAAEDRRQGPAGDQGRGQGHRRDPRGHGPGRLREHRLPADSPDLPVGGAARVRAALSGSGPDRTVNGCPLYDQDATWARDRAAAQIGAVSKAAAKAAGIETLDLLNAFQGHEFCSKTAAQSTPFSRPLAGGAEWGRFLGASTVQQGELQEAFHPNAFGQRALGACVTRRSRPHRARSPARGAQVWTRAGSYWPARAPSRARASPAALAARSPIGPKSIGRLGLGVTRRRLLASPRLASLSATSRSSRRYRYCVKKSRGTVTAVFGTGTKVELLLATPAKYGNRGVQPGATLRTAKRRFRGLTRVKGTSVYRFSRRSRRLIGVRKGRVRYVGVASKRVLKTQAIAAGLRDPGGVVDPAQGVSHRSRTGPFGRACGTRRRPGHDRGRRCRL